MVVEGRREGKQGGRRGGRRGDKREGLRRRGEGSTLEGAEPEPERVRVRSLPDEGLRFFAFR